jgi:hypothetical protein
MRDCFNTTGNCSEVFFLTRISSMVELQAALDAGGGIRTLKPVRAVVFETDRDV